MIDKRVGAPFLLSAEVDIAERGYAAFDTGALSNPYNTAMVIDSIRMMTQSDTVDTELGLNAFGGSVRARFTLGKRELSRAYVPLALHGPLLQYTPQNGGFTYESELGVEGIFAAGASSYSTYIWKLPRPLIVPQNEVLMAEVTRQADAQGGNVRVKVAYAGRRLPSTFEMPRTLEVPFVGVYLPGVQTSSTAGVQSSELDLVNQFNDKVLHVQRLCGRVFRQRPVGGLPVLDLANGTGNIQMFHSDERTVVRDLTPFMRVFDISTRVWEMPFDLAPKARINVLMNSFAVDTEPMVSLVGWRTEEL